MIAAVACIVGVLALSVGGFVLGAGIVLVVAILRDGNTRQRVAEAWRTRGVVTGKRFSEDPEYARERDREAA